MDDIDCPILPDANILDIDGGVVLQIEDMLNEGNRWRHLLKAMPEYYSGMDIARKLENCASFFSTPAKELLLHLSSLGVTVDMIVTWLEEINLERALLLLKPDECLEILEQPVSQVVLSEGIQSRLKLTCRAKGFPTPCYQWFKGEEELITCQSPKLDKSSITLDDAGLYVCRVHTWNRKTGEVHWLFSKGTEVIIQPAQEYRILLNRQHLQQNILPSIELPDHSEVSLFNDGNKLQSSLCSDESINSIKHKQCTTGKHDICYVSNIKQEKVFSASDCHSGPNINVLKLEQQQQGTPKIIRQPISPTNEKIKQGSSVSLHCEGRSQSEVKYQWYRNGLILKGETNSDIKLLDLYPDPDSGETKWYFHCCLYNDNGYIFTNSVEIELDISCENTQYYAEDKVALLIANDTYDSQDMNDLRVPASDVETMAKLLLTLEFKVIAFRNLNKNEMLKAVDLFCSFLRKGVYGIFYYVGHGFEQYGQCYLQPVDCISYVPEECLCAQYVLQCMQEKNPALCILLLDACRVLPPQYKQGKMLTPGRIFEPKMSRNTVIGYATSFLCDSLEADGAKNGFFVKYLQKYMLQKRKIQDILFAVQQEFEKDRIIRNHQHPWIGSSLCSSMTLADPIIGDDNTYKELEKKWQCLTRLPSDIILPISNKNIAVVLHFDKAENTFCNCLRILVKIRSLNSELTSLYEYDATIQFLSDIVETEIISVPAHLRTKTEKACCIFDIQHLQRLQNEPLTGKVWISHKRSPLGWISASFGHPAVSQFDL